MNKEIIEIPDEDLGLGAKVIEENHARFINRDGSLNVHKKGQLSRGTFSLYHAILNTSWPKFYLGVLSFYFIANAFFTLLYVMASPIAFTEIAHLDTITRFEKLFFYSIQVLTTLGGSPLHPQTTWTNILLSVEAMAGILGFSLGAGLIFARFSNPSVRIAFSKQAVIAPYGEIKGFMLRIINERNTELADVKANVTLSYADKTGKRSFHRLELERDKVSSFPLSWTIVHPINEESPLWGMSEEEMAKSQAEFLVTIKATDTDLSREVYARFSYIPSEIMFNSKFKYIVEHAGDGSVVVDPKRIHEIEPA